MKQSIESLLSQIQLAELYIIDGDLKLAQNTLTAHFNETTAQTIYDELIAKYINAPNCEIIDDLEL